MNTICDITPLSLKKIQSVIARSFTKLRKDKASILDIKLNITDMIDEFSKGYSLEGAPQIINLVYKLATSYGFVNQDTNFFTVENLTNLLTEAKLGIKRNNILENSTELITDVKLANTRLEVNEEFLDNAYGLAKDVRISLENLTNRNLFDCCFINRGSFNNNLGIVKNLSELNSNIRQYQLYLLSKIITYFKSIAKDSKKVKLSDEFKAILNNPVLYDTNNKNTGILNNPELLYWIRSYVSPSMFTSEVEKVDTLRRWYNTANDQNATKEDRENAQISLDAYNANVILTHFDSYLSLMLGKSVHIDDFNQKTGTDKYLIAGKTSNTATTWRTSENIDPEKEADSITKLAINTSPLFRWLNDTPVMNNYIHFLDFEHIIAKIKDLSYREDILNLSFDDFADKHSEAWNLLTLETRQFLAGKTLAQAINLIRRNPRQYLRSIFEILTNNDFYTTYKELFLSKKVFTDDELDKLYSVSLNIFNPKSKFSLYTLSDLDTDIDFYAYITQTVDSIFNVHYLQYYRDPDGNILVRTLIDLGVNNVRRNIELTINTSNSLSLIKNFEEYLNELKLKPNDGEFESITYIIPNTNIEVEAVASSGSVTFTDLDTNKKFTNFEQLWNNPDIKVYIDLVLRLGISDNIDLVNAIRNEFTSYTDMCKSLLLFAARVHLNQYVSNTIKDKGFLELRDYLSKLYGKNAPKYNYLLGELGLVHGSDIPTLRYLAKAKSNIIGLATSAQVKDGEGNSLSLQTLSRLLGSILSQFDLLEKQPLSATSDCLILNVPGLYEDVLTVQEYNSFDENKSTVDMNASEMAYSGLVQDFIGGLITRDDGIVGNGHVLFLPSVNSDKGTIGRIKINLNKTIDLLMYDNFIKSRLLTNQDFINYRALRNITDDKIYAKETKIGFREYLKTIKKANEYITKPIRDLKPNELEYIIAQEFGAIYTKMYKAVTADWAILDSFIASKDIKTPSLAHDYLYSFTNFNSWWNTEGSHIETRNGKEIRVGNTYGETSPAEFIKKITLEYNKTNRLHPLEIIDQIHYKNNKGKLTINDAFIALIARFNPLFLLSLDSQFDLTQYPTSQLFWNIKKVEVLKGLIKSNFKINTTNNSPEAQYIRQHYKTWINKSGDVILAKIGDVKVASKRDLLRLAANYKIDNSLHPNELIDELLKRTNFELNPFIELYNYLDYLFTLEFMLSTVGTFIAHPEKSKDWSLEEIAKNGRLETNIERVLRKEAAHFLALHKRNVSFTAAMHAFLLNLLNGIPEEYNIAVIEDVTDEQGTVSGLLNEIKPFDGATFVNPFIVYLENASLGGAKAGITKKLFVHFKNERTGSGGIIKTAGFGLTNDLIRNSQLFDKMMRKMTNHRWLNQNGSVASIDITHDYLGNKINYKDIYFTKNGLVYKIENIDVITNIAGEYRYIPTITNIDTKLVLSKEEIADLYKDVLNISDGGFEINTNYLLWNFFGGKNSMTLKGKLLELSETSIENVVIAMNNIGTIIGNPTKIETLEQLWQPLKRVDVHYVPTAGAVKQGAANINSKAKYENDEDYDILKIKMYQSGILLDKEHHADESELSLMTLVISACAAKGYTFTAASKIYKALREATNLGIKEHLAAISDLFVTRSTTNILEVLIKTLIDALGTSKGNSGNFAAIIASNLIKLAKDGTKIKFSEVLLPLSDNTVYAKVLSTVTSYLTNSGIKLKIPGILSVLTPSYNIFKLYGDRKYESFTDPERELAELQAQQLPVYDGTDPNSISNLELGREYFVTRDIITEVEDADGNLIQVPVPLTLSELIRTPLEYRRLKQDILEGKVTRVVENVIAGRDLAAYNVRFTTVNGLRFLLWDLDSASALFEYHDIIDKAKKDYAKAQTITEKEAVIVKKNMDLTAIFLSVFPDMPIQIDKMETLLLRQLQLDLNNLSNSVPSIIPEYNTLLNSRDTWQSTVQESSTTWYDRYAQWVNIYLGTGNGSKLEINGELQSVKPDNFESIEKEVRKILDNTTKVRINGLLQLVDKTSILTQPYEIIMPKIFATYFGLKEFDSLEKIKNDKDFFIKQYLENQTTLVLEKQYTVELKISNGNHYYLLDKSQVNNSELTKIPDSLIKKIEVDNKWYRLDEDDETMYEFIEGTEIYTDNLGHEVIVTDNIPAYVNTLHFDSIKLSSNLKTRPGLVDSLIKQFSESKKKSVQFFARYVKSYGNNTDLILKLGNLYSSLEALINGDTYRIVLSKYSLSITDLQDIEIDGNIYRIGLDENKNKVIITNNISALDRFITNRAVIKAEREKHTSLLKSLDIVAARIPALHMQSFMPMRVVAYDNPDRNTAFVSTMQILLLGSDF